MKRPSAKLTAREAAILDAIKTAPSLDTRVTTDEIAAMAGLDVGTVATVLSKLKHFTHAPWGHVRYDRILRSERPEATGGAVWVWGYWWDASARRVTKAKPQRRRGNSLPVEHHDDVVVPVVDAVLDTTPIVLDAAWQVVLRGERSYVLQHEGQLYKANPINVDDI